jgi:putative nucleotidyltransferase with HDIG domain
MTRPPRITLEITLTLFLALTGQTLLLIPHRQESLISGFPPVLITTVGIAIWLLSRWLKITIVANTYNGRRFTPYVAGAAIGIFVFRYIQTGFLIEGCLLAMLAINLFIPHRRQIDKPGQFTSSLAITLGNMILGTILTFAPRLLLTPIYIPLLHWQTELGIAFFLSGLYALPLLIRKKQSGASSLPRYLLAVPWAGYTLLFLLHGRMASGLAAFSLLFYLAASENIPWQRLVLSPGDRMGRRLIQALHTIETILLFMLAGLLSLTGPIGEGFEAHDAIWIFFAIMASITTTGTLAAYNTILNSVSTSRPSAQAGIGLPLNGNTKLVHQAFAPFVKRFSKHEFNIFARLQTLEQKILEVEQQLTLEKKRVNQLILLNELSRQLETQLDQPVAAQLAVNMLERALNCALAIVFQPVINRRQFKIMATAGSHINTLPPSYSQSMQSGVLGRTARQRKTQVVQDTRLDEDYVCLGEHRFLSEVSVPIIHRGHLKGILVVDSEKVAAFSSVDVEMIEAVAAELIRAWERSSYQQRLTDLIQAGISLSTLLNLQTAISKVASVSQKTLEAQFTFVALFDNGKLSHTAHAGSAPELLNDLRSNPPENIVLQIASSASRPFRIRDVRKHRQTNHLHLDSPRLRSLLVIPIRLHRRNIGAILSFGKQDEIFFSENDESLAGLLSSQAVAAIESAWLYQELRNTLQTTTLLFHLSSGVIQAEGIDQAAKIVAETAFHLANARQVGIALFTTEKTLETQLVVDNLGTHHSVEQPYDLIEKACQSGQRIFISTTSDSARVCYPLQTPLRNYGALWLEISDANQFSSRYSSNLQALANQAAVALERAILLAESRQQAQALENAYQEMEKTYDQTLAALTFALDARDRETRGHSLRVAQIASRLGQALGLSERQIKALERGALLHDIGKIGISDTILHKPAPLTEAEWEMMRMHPEIGARIVEGIPFLEESLPVIRYHQERWDGSGYPIGLQKNDIPLMARIFAVADVFDALTSARPYRKKVTVEKALAYIKNQAGILLDPEIVAVFISLAESGKINDLIAT